jgi:hypothetical protein
MIRTSSLLAVLCTGLALGALAMAIVLSGRDQQRIVDEIPQLDPIAATPDIADIREARGSVLAGSSLVDAEDSTEFSTALANLTGAEPPVAAFREGLMTQLGHAAREYAEHAERYEAKGDYEMADELRHLSEETRRTARRLAKDGAVQARITFGSDSR